mgnify:CR=1
MPEPDSLGNIIPDFSRVMDQWGDQIISDVQRGRIAVPFAMEMRQMIQQLIDRAVAFFLRKGCLGTIL